MTERFPIRFLTLTLIFTALFLGAMIAHISYSYRSSKLTREKEIRISALKGVITHLDEVLTMSARMAASTGESRWEERYNRFVQPLDNAIKEATQIYPGTYESEAAGQTDAANLKLVEMETKSFELVRKGNKEEARAVLFSKEYEAQKAIYAEGMEHFTDKLWDKVQAALKLERMKTIAAILISTIIFPMLILAWIFVLRTLHRWHHALTDSNLQLDRKVAERTVELTQKNLDLQSEITLRKQMENALVQSEKMSAVGQLAGGVAHEINNPLGIILGFAQIVSKKVNEGDPLHSPLKSIEREAIRCKNLVQDLLQFSRSSEEDHFESINPNDVIQNSLSLIAAQAKVKDVEIVKDMEPTLSKINANKNQLQQVVINLANNAIDAMKEGGKLVLRTQQSKSEKGGIEIQVEDNGSGIPKEIQNKIFEPFFTTKGIGKGTGLGLSLVYEIVKKHKGIINLESEPGKGTKFIVHLPAQNSDFNLPN